MRPGRARALRQFTESTGQSAGRNSSGRITVFHQGGGSKRLLRRIDLKRIWLSLSFSIASVYFFIHLCLFLYNLFSILLWLSIDYSCSVVTDAGGAVIDLNEKPSLKSMYSQIESWESQQPRNREILANLARVEEMVYQLENERDINRREELATRVGWEVRELQRRFRVFCQQDALREREIAEWRGFLYNGYP